MRQATSSFGSATALVAALDPNGAGKLGVANLGDSGLRREPKVEIRLWGTYGVHRVLRWSKSFAETPNTVHIAFRLLANLHADATQPATGHLALPVLVFPFP